jgi:hypothetical protein
MVLDIDCECYIPDEYKGRASEDKICNARGIRLLDFCKATNMRIVNVRLGNDNNYNKWSYTYFSRNLCSTIDYLLT